MTIAPSPRRTPGPKNTLVSVLAAPVLLDSGFRRNDEM